MGHLIAFLAPWAGIIGAAIGVPLLVSLYLLKLRRKPLKVSSVLLWEQAVQDLQANVPLRWLKWSWWMVLQLVALGCLLIAMARPTVPGGAEMGGAARAIIVIDASASMSAIDGAGGTIEKPATRLDEAKRRAVEFVEQLRRAGGTRAQAMVMCFSHEARVVQGFTGDARALREAIEGIRGTDEVAGVEAMDDVVRIAGAAALAGVDAEGVRAGPRTAMVVFSDGAIAETRERLPGMVDVRLVRVGPEPATRPDNLGIVSIAAKRDAENPAVARVFVRVTNSGEKSVGVTLTSSVDGESAGLLSLDVPGGGEASGTIAVENPGAGLVVVAMSRPDVLAADNAAAVVLSASARPRILVVGPNEAGDPYAAARGPLGIDRFLLGALQDLEPASVRTTDIAGYRAMSAGGDAGGVGEFDLIVFDRTTPVEMPRVPTISIGARAPIAGVEVESAEAGGGATRFISWKRRHPIMRHVVPDSVLVSPPMRMRIEEDKSTTRSVVVPRATALAEGERGPLIALVEEPGVRGVKRLVLAFDLIRTNWGQDASFPVFVSSAVDYLTGRGEASAGAWVRAGETVVVRAAAGVKTVKVEGPEAMEAAVNAEGAATIGSLRLAGVYRCVGAEAGSERIAVNLADAGESSVATRDGIVIGGREARGGTAQAGEPPRREVWHWFVIAAGALLTVEWFVYAAKARK